MKTLLLVVGIIIAVALVIIAIVVLSIIRCVHKNIGSLGSVAQQIKEASDEIDNTPKTLASVEGVYMRQIKEDFPEFNLQLVKSYIKSFAAMYFTAVSGGKFVKSDFEEHCSHQLIDLIAAKSSSGETFKNVKIHKIVVSDYRKSTYDVSVIFALAVEYRHNNRSNVSQERYEVAYTYFLEDGAHQELSSMKCPNCGAPIESLERDFCPYCDYKLNINEEAIVIDRTWKITDIKICQ